MADSDTRFARLGKKQNLATCCLRNVCLKYRHGKSKQRWEKIHSVSPKPGNSIQPDSCLQPAVLLERVGKGQAPRKRGQLWPPLHPHLRAELRCEGQSLAGPCGDAERHVPQTGDGDILPSVTNRPLVRGRCHGSGEATESQPRPRVRKGTEEPQPDQHPREQGCSEEPAHGVRGPAAAAATDSGLGRKAGPQ